MARSWNWTTAATGSWASRMPPNGACRYRNCYGRDSGRFKDVPSSRARHAGTPCPAYSHPMPPSWRSPAWVALHHVDEGIDRETALARIGRRDIVIVDARRMQRVLPVDQQPVEHGIDLGDLLEQRGVAVDVAGSRRIVALAFGLQSTEVGLPTRLVDGLESGLPMAVERGAAPTAMEQVKHRGQSVRTDRIDMRHPLQEPQLLRRRGHKRVVAHRKPEVAGPYSEVLGQQRVEHRLE